MPRRKKERKSSNKLNMKQKRFCEYIVIENLTQTDAYLKAYPKLRSNQTEEKRRKTAESCASQLVSKLIIVNYIEELKTSYYKDRMKQIEDLFPETMSQFKRILTSAKSNAHVMMAIQEVWDRLIPKERKETITIEYINVIINKQITIIKEEIKDEALRNRISERFGNLVEQATTRKFETAGEDRL